MGNTTVQEAMTPSPKSIESDASVIDAARLLTSEDVGSLPVVEGDQLVGLGVGARVVDLFRRARRVGIVVGPGADRVRAVRRHLQDGGLGEDAAQEDAERYWSTVQDWHPRGDTVDELSPLSFPLVRRS